MNNPNGVSEVLVDGIQAVGTHNGIVRIQLFALTADGKPKTTAVLHIPQTQLKEFVGGLAKSVK